MLNSFNFYQDFAVDKMKTYAEDLDLELEEFAEIIVESVNNIMVSLPPITIYQL